MESIKFVVYGKPQSLQRHRTGSNGHRYDPSEGSKKDFLAQAIAHKPDKPLTGEMELKVTLYFARPKKHYHTGKRSDVLRVDAPDRHKNTPDADNVLKFVGDALNGIFWQDDKTITDANIRKRYSDTPRIVVEINELSPFVRRTRDGNI